MSGFHLAEQYENILEVNHVLVESLPRSPAGREPSHTWSLVWAHGVVSLGPVENKAAARKAAAIFVTLYNHGVPVEFAIDRARDFAYIATLHVRLDEANHKVWAHQKQDWDHRHTIPRSPNEPE